MTQPDRLRRALARSPVELTPTSGLAAVSAIFTHDLELLLIRRAEYPGDPWSGHVAFPGGGMEATDPTPLHAAIRETQEEVGLALSAAQTLGALDDIAAVGGRPGLIVRPFVFLLDGPLPTLTPNREVAETLLVPLDTLLGGAGRGDMAWTIPGTTVTWTLPCVDLASSNAPGGTVRLWGLTLKMVDDLLHRIDGGGVGLVR